MYDEIGNIVNGVFLLFGHSETKQAREGQAKEERTCLMEGKKKRKNIDTRE